MSEIRLRTDTYRVTHEADRIALLKPGLLHSIAGYCRRDAMQIAGKRT